ncbi:MAG TPA: hypothetical protein VFW86_03895, partial [Candidatus Limnocylindrales bacterium]|nr:hypothetical protein [Candidatus Limnocylindrales bacterium]
GTIFEHLGFTPDRITELARRVVRDGLHGVIPTAEPGHQPPGLAALRQARLDDTRARDGAASSSGTGAGDHPSVKGGESGVGRTSGSDPGHS